MNHAPTALRRLTILAIGVIAYAGFHGVFLYMLAFLNGAPVPTTVEGAGSLPLAFALAANLALVALFGVQHAIMARPAFKRAWTRIVPESLERSIFVIATVACLGAAMAFWQPVAGTLYSIEAPAVRIALYVVQAAGWAVLVYTTFLIDHFELFGLRQVWSQFRGTEMPVQRFRAPSLYRFSRHPMMVGLIIGMWVTPDMTAGRLVWAAGFTAYLLVGIRMEERDLAARLGHAYRDYQARVPRLVPRLGLPGWARRQPGLGSERATIPAS